MSAIASGAVKGGLGLLGVTGGLLRSNPILGGSAAILGADFVGDVASDVFDSVGGGEDRVEAAYAQAQVDRRSVLLQQLRMKRLLASRQQNLARLAALSPSVYNAVAYGREFPQGAIPIGGVPNEQALNEVADLMGAGVFGQQGV